MALQLVLLAGLVPAALAQANARWNRVTSSSALGPRVYATGFASRQLGDAVVLGGTTGTDPGVNPTARRLSYDMTSGTLTETPEPLAWRLDRSAVARGPDGVVYAYGGTNAAGTADANDLLVLDPSQALRDWTVLSPSTLRRPSARKLSTLTYMRSCNNTAEDCLVLVGGDTNGNRLSDVWAFYLTRRLWDQPANAQLAPRPPTHRSAAAVANADGSSLYLFGGDMTTGASSDMYVLAPRGFSDSSPASEMQNIALGRPAFSSSLYKIIPGTIATWCAPSLAVDGVRTQNLITLGNAQCFHSNATGTTGTGLPGEFDPWWYVDLGSSQSFDAVSIYGRTSQESGNGKYTGFQVWFGNSATPPNRATSSPPGAGANSLCVGQPSDIGAGDVSTINCAGAVGRYVWVYLPPSPSANRFLSLCEVEVLQRKPWTWRRLSGLTNVALGKPAFASSIYFNGAWAGAPEQATDGVLTTTFPFMSHTLEYQPNCDSIHLTVDLLDRFEPSSMTLFTRLDCCPERRTRFEAYLGDSRDWKYNTKLWGPVDASPLSGQSRTFTLPAALKARGRYVTIRRAPFNPANCAAPNGVLDDKNVLSVVELQLQAPLLLDQPSARYGMGFTYYRGSLVIFGGQDGSGFRLNDVRFFSTATQKWLAPLAPLGTPPQARAFALLLPMPNASIVGQPEGAPWVPSQTLALSGGSSAIGDGIGDFNVLNFVPCAPLPRAAAPGIDGIATEVCTAAGTVCTYTCVNGFVAANTAGSSNTIVCHPDGYWVGNVPVCVPAAGPPAPLTVSASLVGNNSALVSWSPPGGSTWPITTFRVSVRPNDWVERFSANAFADASQWYLATPDQPQTHRFSFANGELVLDGAEGASCNANDPYNCMTLLRNWPPESGIDPAGSWAIETYLRMDTETSRQGQNFQNIGLCVYDTANWRGWNGRPLGTCEFYGGVRKTGGVWQYGWEGLFGASPFNTWYNVDKPAAYVRLERDAAAQTFRILFKFRPGDDWIPNPRVAADSMLVNQSIGAPSNIKIGLVARTWSGTTRCMGFFSYLRILPLASCAEPGTVRLVNASAGNSALVTGLSPNTSYAFSVESGSAAGARVLFSAPASTAGTVLTPAVPPEQWVNFPGTNVTITIAARRLVEVLMARGPNSITMPSVWNNDWNTNGGPAFLNGNINDYAQAGYNNIIADDGDWAAFDLGIVTSVKAMYIVNRQGCCRNRVQTLEWYVGNSPPTGRAPWRANVKCDMSLYPNLNDPTPVYDPSLGFPAPYSNYFQCTLTGRYVYLRAPQSLGQLNVADGQYNVAELRIYASNSCPPRNGTGTVAVTPATCNGGGYGSVCVHTCKPGFVPVSGNGVSTCSGDVWDAPQLVCTAVCPDLPAPAYNDACTQTLFSESFDVGTNATVGSRWASLEPATQNFGYKWFVNDGVLAATARTGCYDQLNAIVNVNKIKEWRSDFTFSARVSSRDRAGLIWKATDKLNMYRFSLDFLSSTTTHKLERVVNGDATTVMDTTLRVVPDRWYTLTVSMSGIAMNVSVDGALLLATRDGTFTSGFVGVYASTTALFDDVSFSTACMYCQNAQNGEACTYSCQDGLISSGPLSRRCVSNESAPVGLWLPDPAATPLTCTLPPPTFIPSVLAVKENSPKNTFVGDALLGSSPAADYQLSWTILSETPWDPAVGNLFYVDSCSGQVKVRQPGLDYERIKNYTLNVRAFILGFDTARTDQLIRVDIIDVDEPPVILDSTLLLPENSPNGTLVGRPRWYDPENSTVTWVLDVDSSGGAFRMHAASGNITVSGLLPERLNFELFGSAPYELQVTATQINSTLAGSGKVYVQLVDANDPPQLVSSTVLRIGQSAFLGSAPVGLLNSTDEDTGAFAAAPTYTLVPPTAVAAGTASGCPTSLATGTMWPTLDGTSGGTPLFTVAPLSGLVSVAPASGIPVWASMPASLSYGALARATYALCANVSDGRAWTTGVAVVVVLADVGSSALVSDIVQPTAGLSTLGGETVSFVGTGFASGTLTSSVYTNGAFAYNASCTVASATAINCTTAPGVGANLQWRFTINGAGVLAAKELVSSYRAPVVTGISGVTNVPTDGNATGFALVTGQLGTFGPPGTVVTFTYGMAYEYGCAQQVRPDAQTALRCVLSPGVGANLPWRLSIGGQVTDSSAYPSTWLISYAAPNITRVTPTCATPGCAYFTLANLSTLGGDALRVEGTNFGPAPGKAGDLVAGFGGLSGNIVGMTCTRSTGAAAHRELTCLVPPGSGRGHAMSLTVGGQASVGGPFLAPEVAGANGTGMHYAPPVVTRVYGPGAVGGATDGGETFYVEGTNFGPLSGINALAVVDYVRYGHAGDEGRYTATDCRVTSVPSSATDGSGGSTPYSTITCATAEGVGRGHWLTLAVNGQTSNLYQANITYAAPQIAAYGGPGSANADTHGGEVTIISGLNFGPGDTNPAYSSYFQSLMRVFYGGRLNDGPFPLLVFNASACRVTKPHTEVQCLTAEGAGKGQTYTMVLDGQRSVVPTTNYAPPQVLTIRGLNGLAMTTAAVSGGTQLVVSGRWFGPPDHQGTNRTLIQAVRFGPTGTEEVIPPSGWVHLNHTAILVTLPPGFGSALKFTVQVADQLSAASTATFSYATPSITLVDPNTAGTFSNPRSPTYITLWTRNLPVLNPRATINVLFGTPTVYDVQTLFYPRNAADVAAATQPDGLTLNVSFALPVNGAGANQGIRLQISMPSADGATTRTQTTGAQLFTYRAPTISSILVSNARFLPANTTRANASDAVPCPFGGVPGPDGFVASCGLLRYRIEVLGSDFSLYDSDLPASLLGGPRGMDRVDAADRALSVYLNRTNGGWVAASPSSAEAYLYSWSHSRIVLLSSQSESSLRVTITSTTYTGTTSTQQVQAAFKAESLEVVLPLAGVDAPFPTTGSDTEYVTARVKGLAGAVDVAVFVGPWRVTKLVNPSTGAPFASQADFMAYVSGTVPADGVWTIRFAVPAGQGRDVPVRIVRTLPDGSTVASSQAATLQYMRPTLSAVDVLDGVTGVVIETVPAVVGALVTVPTDGSVRLRVRGTNFGVAPTVLRGDGVRSSVNASLPCPVALGLTLHACLEVSMPEGEGNGLQYYPATGFVVAIEADAGGDEATLVVSNALSMTYAAPQIDGVVSSDPIEAGGVGFPTSGNITITVTGRNFGRALPGRGTSELAVAFRMATPGADDVQACRDVTRLNHTAMTCTLPEGSGAGLWVDVTVARQTNSSSTPFFSYNAPLITAVSSSEGVEASDAGFTFPLLRGSTNGTALITLDGRDFGAAARGKHCVFMAWSRRPLVAANKFVCNEHEDFLGEGEVPFSRIVSWSHTRIVFRALPGLGHKELQLSIRGAQTRDGAGRYSVRVPYFRYADPVITTVAPGLFDTDGGDVVTVTGANFGPALWSWEAGNFTSERDAFVPPLPIDNLGPGDLEPWRLPTAFLAVAWHRTCVAVALDVAGFDLSSAYVVPVVGGNKEMRTCDRRVLAVDHNRLLFAAPAGIGRGREMRVVVVDAPYTIDSNATFVSYFPPNITQYNPKELLVHPTEPDTALTKVQGRYFGRKSLAAAQGWTDDELRVEMAVGGVPCAKALREVDPEDPFEKPEIHCYLNVSSTPCGYANATLLVAGQTGFKDSWPRSESLVIACAQGAYGRVNETCWPCPVQSVLDSLRGADCFGYDPRTTTPFELRFRYPKPRPGWFNLNSSDVISARNAPGASMMAACPSGRRDGNRDVCIVPCEPREACLGDNFCAEGYTSKAPYFRCASCDKGFFKRAGACIKCPDSPAGLFVGFIALVMAVAVLGFLLNKRQVNIAVASIGIDYFQVLAIFSQSKVQWPPAVKELMHILSAFNLNIEIVAPECLIPDVSYKQKFAFIMLLPLCVAGLLCAVFLYMAAYKKLVLKRTRRTLFSHTPTLISSLLVLTYLMYLYITRTLLDVFTCSPTNPPDGKKYLSAVFEECGVPGGTQEVLLPFAIAGFIVYTAGYPAYMSWMLWRNRERVMEDQLLRAKGVGNDKLTNPHCYLLRRKYSRSYFAFRPDTAPFWVVLIILRKFFIAVTSVVFTMSASFQMAACLLVMFCAYGLQVRFSPYMSPSDYDAVLKHHTEKAFTSALHARLRASIISVETRGRKRARRNIMTPEGKVDRSAVLGVLGSWVFNYNTIESVMLFAAVIVCLLGIMYQSDGISNGFYPEARDSVTSVVLGVIILSILYWLVALISEMVILITEGQREKRMRAASARKSSRKMLEGGSDRSAGSAGSSLSSIPSGLAKGSIYERSALERSGAFTAGAVETSFNPLALAQAQSQGSAPGFDVSGMDVVDSVAGMTGPPPPEVWRVFQGAFKEMHQQLVEGKLQTAQLMSQLAVAAGGGDPLENAARKSAFEPQHTLGGGGSSGAPSPGASSGGRPTSSLGSFRSSAITQRGLKM